MNFTVNEITNSIAGKPSLSQCSLEELRQIANQYPFFGPAQFLFVKKLKEEDSWQLKDQIQKASLYFQNPLWFDHLLNATAPTPVAPAIKKEEFIPEPATEMEIPVTQEEVVDHLLNTTAPAPVAVAIKKEESIPEPAVEMEIPVTHEEVVDQTRVTRQPEFIQAGSQFERHQPELLVEMPKFKFEPVDVSKSELTFEPYHTIDYFASQGIKPKLEEKPKDQFSRQLKSFTEWLKVMKKLPVTEMAAAVSVVDEKKVEKMAELSINDREIVTEAMAEVWEKQGNQPKAKETYEKLSLLNPGKSSYFASKIEQLKNL